MSSTTEEKQQEAVENGVPSPQNTEETTSASEKGRVPIPRFKKPRLIIILEKRRHFGSSVKENRISFFPAENAQIKCS